jgi:hypothetical protein
LRRLGGMDIGGLEVWRGTYEVQYAPEIATRYPHL